MWVFPWMVVPPKHPKMFIFSRKTHGIHVGEYTVRPMDASWVWLQECLLQQKLDIQALSLRDLLWKKLWFCKYVYIWGYLLICTYIALYSISLFLYIYIYISHVKLGFVSHVQKWWSLPGPNGGNQLRAQGMWLKKCLFQVCLIRMNPEEDGPNQVEIPELLENLLYQHESRRQWPYDRGWDGCASARTYASSQKDEGQPTADGIGCWLHLHRGQTLAIVSHVDVPHWYDGHRCCDSGPRKWCQVSCFRFEWNRSGRFEHRSCIWCKSWGLQKTVKKQSFLDPVIKLPSGIYWWTCRGFCCHCSSSCRQWKYKKLLCRIQVVEVFLELNPPEIWQKTPKIAMFEKKIHFPYHHLWYLYEISEGILQN